MTTRPATAGASRRRPSSATAATSAPPASSSGADGGALQGGCACGALRYRLTRAPLFVHCCHCTRCQRETGGPFAHHALIEASAFECHGAEPDYSEVPADSGSRHRVAHCPRCRTVLWNQWGSGSPLTLYVRVGTLDEPGRFPPQAHIYARSAQPWLASPPGGAPVYRRGYDARRLWPPDSLARHDAARAAIRGTPASATGP